MNSLQNLIVSIGKWAEDRNLIDGSTPQKQAQKLAEEIGELCKGLNKCDAYLIKDALGDCFVVSVIFSLQCKVKLNMDNIDDRVISNYEFYLSGLLQQSGRFISPLHPINNGFLNVLKNQKS